VAATTDPGFDVGARESANGAGRRERGEMADLGGRSWCRAPRAPRGLMGSVRVPEYVRNRAKRAVMNSKEGMLGQDIEVR